MSTELLLFLGLLSTAWGLDEYLPSKTRFPVKLGLGIICLILWLFFNVAFHPVVIK